MCWHVCMCVCVRFIDVGCVIEFEMVFKVRAHSRKIIFIKAIEQSFEMSFRIFILKAQNHFESGM